MSFIIKADEFIEKSPDEFSVKQMRALYDFAAFLDRARLTRDETAEGGAAGDLPKIVHCLDCSTPRKVIALVLEECPQCGAPEREESLPGRFA